MGTCFGYFRKRHKTKRHVCLHRCFYFHDKDKVEFELLVDGEPKSSAEFIAETTDVWCTSSRCFGWTETYVAFSSEGKHAGIAKESSLTLWLQKPTLKRWTDDSGSSCMLEGEATQLLPLDAHSLLASRALQTRKISWSSSTPPSSIDLEWENEGGITNIVPRLKSQRSSSSNVEETSSGCGGGSPDSLEWDPGTDGETENLISEIERLTARALRETGVWSATSEPL